ncbi:MAG: 2Fe-2S iron-sulfur cluster binding domain-containing protein [Bdellovibrionaceae bacterium]|nr:2Fe-2S iron-sulfur cluster binding domain-containing protein [Bdellovibrio sp.]
MSDSTKTLTILGNNRTLEFKGAVNVLDFLNAKKVGIGQSCGGSGTCTTCRIFILKGIEYANPRTELELERANERSFLTYERLACQTEISGSVVIEIPDDQ